MVVVDDTLCHFGGVTFFAIELFSPIEDSSGGLQFI